MQTEKQSPLSNPLYVCLLAAVSCLLWGSATPAIKTGYRLFSIAGEQTWTMILFAGMRFTIAGLLVLTYASCRARHLLLPVSWGRVVKISLFQTIGQYLFFYIGVAHSTGVHTAILTGASNLWAILLACFLFRQEKMNAPKLAGCLLGFGGILVMNLSGSGGGVSFMGEGLLLISGLCSGVSSGLCKNYSRTEDPVALTAWQFLFGGLCMCACALIAGARLTIPSVAAGGILLYLGFLSALAYTLWTLLLKHNPVSSVTIYGFMNPVFGLLLSALILGETEQAFSPSTLIALLLVCCGIVAVNRYGNSAAKSTKPHK